MPVGRDGGVRVAGFGVGGATELGGAGRVVVVLVDDVVVVDAYLAGTNGSSSLLHPASTTRPTTSASRFHMGGDGDASDGRGQGLLVTVTAPPGRSP
ncbi:MAG: hypothetical protein JWN67_4150 [Actinomycetia bacterium]|nr:hypothetical protein [Actinomycetes bacterium]